MRKYNQLSQAYDERDVDQSWSIIGMALGSNGGGEGVLLIHIDILDWILGIVFVYCYRYFERAIHAVIASM